MNFPAYKHPSSGHVCPWTAAHHHLAHAVMALQEAQEDADIDARSEANVMAQNAVQVLSRLRQTMEALGLR